MLIKTKSTGDIQLQINTGSIYSIIFHTTSITRNQQSMQHWREKATDSQYFDFIDSMKIKYIDQLQNLIQSEDYLSKSIIENLTKTGRLTDAQCSIPYDLQIFQTYFFIHSQKGVQGFLGDSRIASRRACLGKFSITPNEVGHIAFTLTWGMA